MSAFILDQKHINALVTWASVTGIEVKGCKVIDHEQGFVTMLHRQNVRSVNYRYDEHTEYYGYKWEPVFVGLHLSKRELLQIIMACKCYRYQSCETDDYETTLAHQMIEDMIDHATWLLGMTKSEVDSELDWYRCNGNELLWAIDDSSEFVAM